MAPQEDNEQELKENNKAIKLLHKPVKLLKEVVTLEPLVVCYVTTKALCEPVFKNLELEKACRVNSHFNDTVCNDIISGLYVKHNFTVQNDIVQSHITRMHSWQLTISNVLTITLILFLGSYSDRYKIRKMFILMSLFGQLLALAGCALCVKYMYEWPLEVLGICQEIVYACFGGDKLLTMLIYAYIADISTPKMRTIRVAIVQALWNVCFTVGQSLSAAIFYKTGYLLIILLASVLCTLAFLYGLFLMEDSRKTEKEISKMEMFKDIFNVQHLMEFSNMFKKYQSTYKTNILCLLVIQCLYSIVINGESTVLFLFTVAAYEWTVTKYSFYMSAVSTMNSFSLFFIVPFLSKVLRLNDLIIILLSFINKVIANIIFGTITSSTGLYIGTAFAILKSIGLVGIRSQLTKYVAQDDVGKILSICIVVDSFCEGVASQIYNNGIYEHTRAVYPQAFFLLAVALYSIGIVILTWMYFTRRIRKSENHLPRKESFVVAVISSIQEREITRL